MQNPFSTYIQVLGVQEVFFSSPRQWRMTNTLAECVVRDLKFYNRGSKSRVAGLDKFCITIHRQGVESVIQCRYWLFEKSKVKTKYVLDKNVEGLAPTMRNIWWACGRYSRIEPLSLLWPSALTLISHPSPLNPQPLSLNPHLPPPPPGC